MDDIFTHRNSSEKQFHVKNTRGDLLARCGVDNIRPIVGVCYLSRRGWAEGFLAFSAVSSSAADIWNHVQNGR
jgi:hypothetical protein